MIVPDEAIVLFLYEHGIEATPPGKRNVLGDALVAGISASEGITAQATAHSARHQGKIAKQQEWISWKQWALSHHEWPDWYSCYKQEYLRKKEEEERRRAYEREMLLQQEMSKAGYTDKEEYAAYKKAQDEKLFRNGVIMLMGVAMLTVGVGAVSSLFEVMKERITTEAEQKQSEVINDCTEKAKADYWSDIINLKGYEERLRLCQKELS